MIILDKQQFRETLLEFLKDVTNIPETPNLEDLIEAPEGFKMLTPFLLIKDRSEELNEKYWLTIHFYTETHRYHISACLKKDNSTYFGAQASTRKPRAGEQWTRGNDLPDGNLTRDMWNRIKNAIIRFEMTRLSDYITKGHYAKPDAQIDAPSIKA